MSSILWSTEEQERYRTHFLLPEVGETGQQKLKEAKVLLIGIGGLGSPVALYLTAAGVGTLGIVDCDRVSKSNLQRQILYTTDDLGQPKVKSAKKRLESLNPLVQVISYQEKVTTQNIRRLVRDYDLVIGGTDNFQATYLINDACVLEHKPFIYGSVIRFQGQIAVFAGESFPCYRCIFPKPPTTEEIPSCSQVGVLGVLPGTIGTLQATEAIKWIIGVPVSLAGYFLIYDALSLRFKRIRIDKNPHCPICSSSSQYYDVTEEPRTCPSICEVQSISVQTLQQWLQEKKEGLILLDVRDSWERELNSIPNSHWVPLAELKQAISTLDPTQLYILYCHHGPRSIAGAKLLQQAGFLSVYFLEGGIDAWAREIDPHCPRY